MMVWKYIILGLIALGGGALISAAVFALIASTGVITRMAGKNQPGKNIKKYETAVVLGGVWWNIFWVFSISMHMPSNIIGVLQPIMGLAHGVFVGCLAVSLAEALNATAIFARRVKLKTGLSFLILSAALGKIIAAFIQFTNGWVKR